MRILLWLTLYSLLNTSAAYAGLLDNPASTRSAVSPAPGSTLSTDPDFLPVHEAYQLEIEIHDRQLLLHWHIAENYFLYGEEFQLVLSHNNTALAVAIQKEKGEIAYDDYFQRDVERFRHATTQTVNLPPDTTGILKLSARFQGCADAGLCYPPETLYYEMDLASGQIAVVNPEAPAPVVMTAPQTSFFLMFVFAMLGGLILNLMPCVFPVLSIKLLSFTRSNESASHLKNHSWFYTFGVLTTFLSIALLLMVLRDTGAAIGWGFQLQSPIFISLLALLFLILGLSMSGFITFGTRWMGVGQQLTTGDHYSSSFFTGVLAVIVASPCSVPFMGIALGFALTQPMPGALIIFMGLGIGLASPFLVFAYVPWLIKHLPKPGPWMEKLKHWLALPLYLSALWLVWVLSHQLATTDTTKAGVDQHWEKYSAETLSAYLNNHEAVFIELTADWCITCLVNEKVALSRPAVLDSMKEKNIHYLRGDWTNGNTEITALLKQYQRGGVPLYLFYDNNGTVTVLPQLLTEQTVLDSLSRPSSGSPFQPLR